MGENVPEIDQKKCIGSGLCSQYAPNTFKLDDRTKKSFVTNPEGDSEDKIQAAVDNCPVQAILWKKKSQA